MPDVPGPGTAARPEPRRVFGRRTGRPLRKAPSSALERLLPRYGLDLSAPLDPPRLFGIPVTAVRLEIGFGGGEHLAAQAVRNPAIGFIGCEPFRNGIASLMQHLEAGEPPNVRVHAGDATAVIERLPAACLARIDLLYPDPWPKRRQRKRRFLSAAMLDHVARLLQPGGTFRFATDIDDYAAWTLDRLLACRGLAWTARTAADWLEPWPDWVPTRYEAKAIAEGRRPVYITAVRR